MTNMWRQIGEIWMNLTWTTLNACVCVFYLCHYTLHQPWLQLWLLIVLRDFCQIVSSWNYCHVLAVGDPHICLRCLQHSTNRSPKAVGNKCGYFCFVFLVGPGTVINVHQHKYPPRLWHQVLLDQGTKPPCTLSSYHTPWPTKRMYFDISPELLQLSLLDYYTRSVLDHCSCDWTEKTWVVRR